jgi:hypothetical protein
VAANNPWNLSFSDVVAGGIGSAATYVFLGGTVVGTGGGFAIGLGSNVIVNFVKIYATAVGMQNDAISAYGKAQQNCYKQWPAASN